MRTDLQARLVTFRCRKGWILRNASHLAELSTPRQLEWMIQNTALNCWNTLIFHTEVPSVWILKINTNQSGKCRQNAFKKTSTLRLQFLPKEAAMIEEIRPSLLTGEMRKRKSFLRNARTQGLLAFQVRKRDKDSIQVTGEYRREKVFKMALNRALWRFVAPGKNILLLCRAQSSANAAIGILFYERLFNFSAAMRFLLLFFNYCWHEFANTNVKNALMFMPRPLTCYDKWPGRLLWNRSKWVIRPQNGDRNFVVSTNFSNVIFVELDLGYLCLFLTYHYHTRQVCWFRGALSSDVDEYSLTSRCQKLLQNRGWVDS